MRIKIAIEVKQNQRYSTAYPAQRLQKGERHFSTTTHKKLKSMSSPAVDRLISITRDRSASFDQDDSQVDAALADMLAQDDGGGGADNQVAEAQVDAPQVEEGQQEKPKVSNLRSMFENANQEKEKDEEKVAEVEGKSIESVVQVESGEREKPQVSNVRSMFEEKKEENSCVPIDVQVSQEGKQVHIGQEQVEKQVQVEQEQVEQIEEEDNVAVKEDENNDEQEQANNDNDNDDDDGDERLKKDLEQRFAGSLFADNAPKQRRMSAILPAIGVPAIGVADEEEDADADASVSVDASVDETSQAADDGGASTTVAGGASVAPSEVPKLAVKAKRRSVVDTTKRRHRKRSSGSRLKKRRSAKGSRRAPNSGKASRRSQPTTPKPTTPKPSGVPDLDLTPGREQASMSSSALASAVDAGGSLSASASAYGDYEGEDGTPRLLWSEGSSEEFSEVSLSEYSADENLDTFALSSDEDEATMTTPRLGGAGSHASLPMPSLPLQSAAAGGVVQLATPISTPKTGADRSMPRQQSLLAMATSAAAALAAGLPHPGRASSSAGASASSAASPSSAAAAAAAAAAASSAAAAGVVAARRFGMPPHALDPMRSVTEQVALLDVRRDSQRIDGVAYYDAVHRESGAPLVVKVHDAVLESSAPSGSGCLVSDDDFDALVSLDHANVVRCYGRWLLPARRQLWIVFGHIDSDATLARLLECAPRQLTDLEVAAIFRQVVAALGALRAHALPLCRVTASRIFVTRQGVAQLLPNVSGLFAGLIGGDDEEQGDDDEEQDHIGLASCVRSVATKPFSEPLRALVSGAARAAESLNALAASDFFSPSSSDVDVLDALLRDSRRRHASTSVDGIDGDGLPSGNFATRSSDVSLSLIADQLALLCGRMVQVQGGVASIDAHTSRQTHHLAVENERLRLQVSTLKAESAKLGQENQRMLQQLHAPKSVSPSAIITSKEKQIDSLRSEVKRLQAMNADFRKNEKAIGRLIGELHTWQERCKQLESQITKKKK
jgi:hypothetical protein